jgi:hypothetical protein
MPDKLRPDVDLLCYFKRPSAIAAISNATATGFMVSGTWRQQFDWCVVDWVRDNTFEHPAFRNLPDGDLSGLTLTYDETRTNCIALDSDLFPTVDWPSLRVFNDTDVLPKFVTLRNYATPLEGSYICASATVQLQGTLTSGDYVGIAFMGEHYTYQVLGTDTIDSVAEQIVLSITKFSAMMAASHNLGSITVTYVGYDSTGTKYSTATSPTGANGNRVGLYTYTTGTTESWDVAWKQFSGGTSPTKWRYVIPFASLVDRDKNGVVTTNVRKLRWTYAADLQAGAYQRSEFAVTISNWTVTGTNRAYSVAGPASRRYEDLSLTLNGAWSRSKGNFSNGTISYTSTPGDSVTCHYSALQNHALYVGTRVLASGGSVEIKVDGQVVRTENLVLAGEDVLVRRLVGNYAAGAHTVQLTHNGAAGSFFYFDFIETAVPTTSVPTYPAEAKLTLATDWDTDHSLALPAERTAGMLNALGFHGRHNLYIGALEFYELYPKGNVYATQTVQFLGTPAPNAIVSLTLQTGSDVTTANTIQHLIHPGDTATTIAKAFELEWNRGYTGVWAQASGNQLTITARALGTEGNILQLSGSPSSGSFTAQITNAGFSGGTEFTWTTDLASIPRINRACRDWMLAFLKVLKNSGIDCSVAFSTELGNGDTGVAAGIAQRYPNGDPVLVSTPALQTNFSPASTQYWQQVYLDAATIQANAGMQPYLQFGEVQWWYFPDASKGGMTFYDAYTLAAFQSQYGRAMTTIADNTVDPSLHPQEAAFLPTLIGAHTTAIMTFVRATYANTRFEVLYPTDVNEGAFNAVINYPAASWTPSALANLKTESFTYTLNRDLKKVMARSLEFGPSMGFTRAQRSHLTGVSDPTTPWLREARLAEVLTADSVVLFALDQFCLAGYPLPLKRGTRRARRLQ